MLDALSLIEEPPETITGMDMEKRAAEELEQAKKDGVM
jgi:hypothetical protein